MPSHPATSRLNTALFKFDGVQPDRSAQSAMYSQIKRLGWCCIGRLSWQLFPLSGLLYSKNSKL